MYFESDVNLEPKLEFIENIYVYSAKKKSDSIKQREIYQISVYYAETSRSHFYKLHLSRVYKQYQIGDNISRHSFKAEKPHMISNSFSCTICKTSQAVRFGPKGNLGMLNSEYRNRGLGRFCMAFLVRRLLSEGLGDYKVASPSLSSQDARNEHDKFVRNNFYNNSGFHFNDINIKDGRCSAPNVSALISTHNRSKVKQITSKRANKLLTNTIDNVSKLEKVIKGRDNNIKSLNYRMKSLEQKHSLAMLSLIAFLIYTMWSLPFIDEIGKGVFSVLLGTFAYYQYFDDAKKWVLQLRNSH